MVPFNWSTGQPLGCIAVKTSKKKMNKFHKEMIKVTKQVLKDVVGEIEVMHIGSADIVANLPADLSGATAAARLLLPKKLLAYARKLLSEMDIKEAIAEIKTYKSPPEVVVKVMRGVLILLGRKKKDLPEWNEVRAALDNKIVDECVALDASAKVSHQPRPHAPDQHQHPRTSAPRGQPHTACPREMSIRKRSTSPPHTGAKRASHWRVGTPRG